MEIGEVVTVNGVTGKLIEIIELETEKRLKLKIDTNKIAIVTYHKASQQGLGTMRLG